MNNKIRASIDEIISTVLGINVRWTVDTTMQDLDADELDMVELAVKLETEFGTEFFADQMTNMITVGELYRYVEERYCMGIQWHDDEEDDGFEKYWENSDIHKAALSNMTGVMDAAMKEISQKAWNACKKWMDDNE